MQPIYEVPIVPQNLRREETVVQIADALKYLSEVSNDIFKRINDRIQKNNVQITSINSRIKSASEKLSKLSGAKKATQVFSSSKYPAADINREYISIFDSKGTLPIQRHTYTYKQSQVKDESSDKLQFFHVNLNNKTIRERSDGLGDIPKDIGMVNDLLLYNSGKNLYNNYIISDSLQVSHQAKKGEVKDISEIGAAPHSISDRTNLNKSLGESYFYTPDLGNVPIIDVPLDLPDLPGIADDLRYLSDSGPGIAPSVTTTPNVPDLPIIKTEETIAPQIDVKIEDIELPAPEISKVKIPVEIKEVEITPVVEEVVVVDSGKVEQPKDIKVPFANEARANLMEAIRKAGGTKTLRAAENKEKAPLATPTDHMAELHAKLSMRRKGISGNKPNSEPSSAMDKVSAMIPPPPMNNDLSETTEDEEWED